MVSVVRQGIVAFLLFVALLSPVHAEEPPLPTLTGRVVDRADILSSSTEATLSAKIEAHEKATTDQIVIVTLPDLMGRPIEDWGLTLGRSWGIGQKGKDNGIIFLIAPQDRELRIEVGYGLEGDLPDATANDIIQSEVIPLFKQGDMEGGITAGLDAILAALGGTYQPTAQPLVTEGQHYSQLVDTLVPFAFFGVFIILAMLMNLRRRWDKRRNRYVWYMAASTGSSSGSSSFGGSSGGFSGGGGSFGGGGASGKW